MMREIGTKGRARAWEFLSEVQRATLRLESQPEHFATVYRHIRLSPVEPFFLAEFTEVFRIEADFEKQVAGRFNQMVDDAIRSQPAVLASG